MCLTVYKHYFKNVPFLGDYLLVKQAMKSYTQYVILILSQSEVVMVRIASIETVTENDIVAS